MNSFHPNAAAIARDYIGSDAPLKVLGWGVDGVVYPSPSATTAVKIHKSQGSFDRELAAYQRLKNYCVTEFQGFAVPSLVNYERARFIIEMSVVKRPFLLDFAGSTLDTPEHYPPHVMQEWWAKVEDLFGDNFATASSVFHGLIQEFGIYYWDLKPGNLEFE